VYVCSAGRPDLKGVFAAAAQAAKENGKSRVAVLVCGPPGLVHDVSVLCDRHNSSMGDVAFDLHMETFEL
jgi:hypothetical protein